MDFEKNETTLIEFDLQVQKCGCTCNGGKEHSGNAQEDNENFNGDEKVSSMYS